MPRHSEGRVKSTKVRPTITPEAKEGQLISLAIDLAEEQLRNKTASAQVITHYLKLGSSKERLERERLEEENKLLRAKTEALQAAKKSEEEYANVLAAMMKYSGKSVDEDEFSY